MPDSLLRTGFPFILENFPIRIEVEPFDQKPIQFEDYECIFGLQEQGLGQLLTKVG
jgi:hypothetical protein